MNALAASIARVTPLREPQTHAERVGARVRSLRLFAGLTQADVARRVRTARRNIARLELGEHEPTLTLLVRVARALDCAPSRILSALDEVTP